LSGGGKCVERNSNSQGGGRGWIPPKGGVFFPFLCLSLMSFLASSGGGPNDSLGKNFVPRYFFTLFGPFGLFPFLAFGALPQFNFFFHFFIFLRASRPKKNPLWKNLVGAGVCLLKGAFSFPFWARFEF